MKHSFPYIFALFCMFTLNGVHAEETRYLDDRSTPASVITSYVNALNSHQYARAWSYGDHEGTSDNYEDLLDQFDGVERVDFRLRKAFAEGAAGSTFTKIPMVMVHYLQDGGELVFSGCITTRMVAPEIQAVPFEPLHIWESALVLAKENFESAQFVDCTN